MATMSVCGIERKASDMKVRADTQGAAWVFGIRVVRVTYRRSQARCTRMHSCLLSMILKIAELGE